jgi:cysteinyl-tRNA synthetase
MDYSDEAMAASDARVKQLRRRMAEWAATPPPQQRSVEAEDFDRRFRGAVGDDLDMPSALKVLNQTVSSSLPEGDKYALLSSWDRVLGLDLDRGAREGFTVPPEVESLVAERDGARTARDFARSDAIRERLMGLGYEVMDTPAGTKVRPRD